jgi:hypothetical protein
MSRNPAVILGLACLAFSVKGCRATAEERAALGRAAEAAPTFDDARLTLLRLTAAECAAADPLTDDHVGRLRAALEGTRMGERDAQGKPRYFFTEGQYA